MKLQTNIPLSKQSNYLIDYKSKCLLLGSCFSEHIGGKFKYFKFKSLQNPFGILFHPIAIERLITRAINSEFFSEEDLIYHNERWHCFDAHSCLSSNKKEELLNNLNNAIKATHQQINESTHVIITLGTAWYYRFIEMDKIVANCHKIPQKKFLKELLSTDKISESLNAIIELIRTVNSHANILFTVSPVRHLKDGFVENQRSKSHLISAIHGIVESQENCFYFPSYEIMMDELRDYRFYNEDMVHPNQLAINYIWNKFKSVWIASESEKIMKTVDDIQKGLAHKPFNPESETHKVFKEKLNSKIEDLRRKEPKINF
ncbi:MAG: GSCFA domain-containing protein [Flavobacteriaceae bacterium]|nr:GSCFA domain-containing protein [Flavobacteriaceae bacterium]